MASRPGTLLTHTLVMAGVLVAALCIFSLFGGAEIVVGNLVLRAQSGASHAIVPPPASAFEAAPFAPTGDAIIDNPPKNVIVIMGDGMGIGAVSAASQLLSPPGIPLTMERAPVVGLMQTWAADSLATDSAAGATAMATGYKTDKGVIGLLPDGRAVRTLFEVAQDAGLRTAVVTTSGLADATPGGFLTHVQSRDDYSLVLNQMLDSEADVLIGGDWLGKEKAWRQQDYREAVEGAEVRGTARGYSMVRDWKDMQTAHLPLIAILPPRPEMPEHHGPPLTEMAGRALDLVEDGGAPFIMLIETEVTDESSHSNDMTMLLEGMLELDATVSSVLDRVASRDDTLVLVVSDHETGGPHLLEGTYEDGEVVVRWAHGYHSSQLVPVFAFGPGASAFSGVWDNTQFGVRIAALLGLEDFPSLADSQHN